MNAGYLYFVKDEFYQKFEGYGLLENHEVINGKAHDRPCCYLFKDKIGEKEIMWMIPISSKVEKYKKLYKHSIDKYGECDNISFCYILGEEKAILPQNLFPITQKYIANIYLNKNTGNPVVIPKNVMTEIHAKARKKIRYNFNNKKLGMTDIVHIYNCLLEETKDTN